MATSNRDRVGKALEALQSGLRPFIEQELKAVHGKYWVTKVTERWPNDLQWDGDEPRLDHRAVGRARRGDGLAGWGRRGRAGSGAGDEGTAAGRSSLPSARSLG